MKALLLKGFFYGWLILAVRECCVCKKQYLCIAEGLPVRFQANCCSDLLDSTYVIRFEMVNPSNRKLFKAPRGAMNKVTGEQAGYELRLAKTLSEIVFPNQSARYQELDRFDDYDEGAIRTKLLPKYGFIVFNRPANFEYRITNIQLKPVDVRCSDEECFETKSFEVNRIFIASDHLVITR